MNNRFTSDYNGPDMSFFNEFDKFIIKSEAQLSDESYRQEMIEKSNKEYFPPIVTSRSSAA